MYESIETRLTYVGFTLQGKVSFNFRGSIVILIFFFFFFFIVYCLFYPPKVLSLFVGLLDICFSFFMLADWIFVSST